MYVFDGPPHQTNPLNRYIKRYFPCKIITMEYQAVKGGFPKGNFLYF